MSDGRDAPGDHRPPTILQVVADGALGGGTTVVLSLIGELLDAGWTVHLATQTGSELAALASQRGATVHPFDFMARLMDRSVTNGLWSLIRSTNPSVVHLHGSRAAFAGHRRPDVPTIYTVHGYHFEQRSLPSRLASIAAERIATRRVALLTFVGTRDEAYNRRLHLSPRRTPTELIRNGVPVGPLERVHTGPIRRLCFVGRLVEQKDPVLAVRALQHLDPEVQLTMVGDGTLRQDVIDEAARLGLSARIDVVGALAAADVADVVRSSDALIMTSRWEGLPMVPLEAMALGTPVVGFDLAPLREIIPSEREGRLVSGCDPRHLAEAVRGLDDPTARDAVARDAHRRVGGEFSWHAAWGRYEQHYLRLAGR